MKKLIIFILLFSISVLSVFAQRPGFDPSKMKKGKITGIVKTEAGEQPLEYANIALYKLKDSSLVTGTVADPDGKYTMKELSFGRYYMEINFIGFKKKVIPDITLTPRNMTQDVGDVYLKEASKEIEGVEVTADRLQVEYKVDKKVVNVSKDFSAEGGSAVTVLENVPSVQVDIEGNVELRGSSNFRVLINGKPTVLTGSEALQQIPAGRIDNIEIITNPSAKYDPEGTAGIINVVMKKQERGGLNGMVKASVGTNNKYDGNINLNYKTGKFNFFTAFDYRNYNFSMDGYDERMSNYGDTLSYMDQDVQRTMGHGGYSVKGGFDYYLTESSTLSLAGRMGTFGFGMDAETQTEAYTDPVSTRDYTLSNSKSEMSHNYYTLSLDYQNQFDSKQHRLDASLYFSNSDNEDENRWDQNITDENWNVLNSLYEQRTLEEGNGGKLQAKLDYVRPISIGKLEAGYQGRLDTRTTNYDLENYESGMWVLNNSYANSTDFERMIQALYTTYSGNIGKFNFKLGIRGEYTNRTLVQKTLDEDFEIDRFDVFPSAHLSQELNKGEQIFASYSRRIRRPRDWFLNPFMSVRDEYTRRIGNPGLEPEYTNSWELGYKTNIKRTFLSLEGYYRQTNNGITRVRTLDQNDIMLNTFKNIGEETSLGVEMMINTNPVKWWNLNMSGNLYQYNITGNVTGQDIDRNSTNWGGRFNNIFKLPTSTQLQLTGFYRGPSVTAQGDREGFFMFSAAIKQSLMDKKLTMTLNARDVLGTMTRDMTMSGEGFETHSYRERESPIINFSVTYTFNNFKQKRRGVNGTGNEFEGMEQF